MSEWLYFHKVTYFVSYFANNKQESLVFFIAHAEHNLIKLKLCNNQAAQDVNNVSESTI